MNRKLEKPLHSLLWMTLSGVGFCSMSVAIKLLNHDLPEFEVILFRTLINLIITTGFLLATMGRPRPRGVLQTIVYASNKRLLVLRGVFGFLGMCCLFYSLAVLPIGLATFLSWCSPVFVLIISWFFLKENVRLESVFWLFVSGIGLSLLFFSNYSTYASQSHVQPQSRHLIGIGVGLFGSLFAGAAYTAVRAATVKAGSHIIIFYLSFVSSLCALPFALYFWKPPTLRQWLLSLIVGLGATVGQYGMTNAYKFSPAGIVSAMGLQGAIFSALMGYFLFAEKLGFFQLIGLGIMAFAIVMLTVRNQGFGLKRNTV